MPHWYLCLLVKSSGGDGQTRTGDQQVSGLSLCSTELHPHMSRSGRVVSAKTPFPTVSFIIHPLLASCSIEPFAARTCAIPLKKAAIRSGCQVENSPISTLTLM